MGKLNNNKTKDKPLELAPKGCLEFASSKIGVCTNLKETCLLEFLKKFSYNNQISA